MRPSLLTAFPLLAILAILTLASRTSPAEEARAPRREDHRYDDKKDLLVVRGDDGTLRPAKTPEDWALRRAHILLALQDVMGPVPEGWRDLPLDPQVHEVVDLPSHVRKKVSFRAEPADRVTAYLLVPKDPPEGSAGRGDGGSAGMGGGASQTAPSSPAPSPRRLPAVLCLHQTTAIGKDEPAGLGANPDLSYAAELAERGYVTLAPDYWTFGDYRDKAYDPYDQGYHSGTMKGIWNHVRSVDYLASLPEVDATRIGCIGHSLGGHNTLWLGAFEPRIRVFVSSSGFNSLTAYAASSYGGGDLKNYAQLRYMPRVARVFGNDPARVPWDYHEVLAALAPRPVFVSAPLGDENFVVEGVRECVAAALPVYSFLGAPGNLVAVHPDAGHSFPKEVRQMAYAFIDRAIGEQGRRFPKKRYEAAPLPSFAATREKLPSPILDEDPAHGACYWKAWEIAFRNFHEPAAGSGYVSQFIDAAFNQNIFLWDTCFLTMFCNVGHPHVPGIGSLDNFYAKQHADGEICREIDRASGKDFGPWVNSEGEPLFSRWGYGIEGGAGKVPVEYVGRDVPFPSPVLTLDALNHPILAWAEVESYRWTADARRLAQVRESLIGYHEALRKYVRQGNGLFMTDWASMDNSPRNPRLAGGGTAVDTSAQMVLFARNLAEIAGILGLGAEAERFEREAQDLSRRINETMWDAEKGFYVDLTRDGRRAGVKTVAGFWTLIAGVAPQDRAAALAAHLRNPRTFGTPHRAPTLAADEEGFDAETGSYWRGAVWAPTTMMVVRGLERFGETELARDIALEHLRHVVDVFEATGTIWENYSPTKAAPGRPAKGDFVGWSGIAPIAFLIEYAIGIDADAAAQRIVWTIRSPGRVGVERLWLGGNVVSLVCEPADERADGAGKRKLRAEASRPLGLEVRLGEERRVVEVPAGEAVEMSL